jgi:hypothetical protein
MSLFSFLSEMERRRAEVEQSLRQVQEAVPRGEPSRPTARSAEEAWRQYLENARQQAQAMYDMAASSPMGEAWRQMIEDSPFIPEELKGRTLKLPEVLTWGERMQLLIDERVRLIIEEEVWPTVNQEIDGLREEMEKTVVRARRAASAAAKKKTATPASTTRRKNTRRAPR